MNKILIENMSWTEFKDAMGETDLIIIPVGVIEAHGCHNPLGTDTIIAEECAKLIGEKARVPVAPVMPFGYTANMTEFPGANSLDPELYRKVLFSYAESYVKHGVKRFLFVNGHGGNTNTLAMVSGDLFDEYGCFCLFNQWWEVLPTLNSEWNCADHGGYFETSMLMGVNPRLVDMDKARTEPVSPLSEGLTYSHGWKYRDAPVPLPVDIRKVNSFGTVGNPPFGANEELGRKMIGAYVDFNVGLVREMLKIQPMASMVR